MYSLENTAAPPIILSLLQCLAPTQSAQQVVGSNIQTFNAIPGHAFALKRLRPRQVLFREGQQFSNIYLVRTGYLKTVRHTDTTHERVLHFPMMLDWVGLEGIGLGNHGYDAIALTHTELVALPFNGLLNAARQDPKLERTLYEAFSLAQSDHERDADLMAVVGAEQRVGRFLALQAHRHARRGLPASAFALPMTRKDIGAFLGLSLETVSRALSALDARGTICVDRRTIHIINAQHLAT